MIIIYPLSKNLSVSPPTGFFCCLRKVLNDNEPESKRSGVKFPVGMADHSASPQQETFRQHFPVGKGSQCALPQQETFRQQFPAAVREASAYYRSRKPFAHSFLSIREASVHHSHRKPFVEAQKYLSFSVNFSPSPQMHIIFLCSSYKFLLLVKRDEE